MNFPRELTRKAPDARFDGEPLRVQPENGGFCSPWSLTGWHKRMALQNGMELRGQSAEPQ